jgi:tetratricopeptide (TPR) repeat protein
MRWLVLTLAAVLALPAAAGAQVAWAKAYEEGVEAFQKGNDALAEAKLTEARNHSRAPKQSRKALFSSVDYRAFIPDYYLGVIYARQGRHKQAQDFLERALRDELVKPEDRASYAMATSSLQRARDEQTRLASSTKPEVRPTPPVDVVRPPVNPPPTNPTTTPTNPNTQAPNTAPGNTTTPATIRPVSPVTPAEPAWLPRFRQAIDAAQLSLRASRYAEARSHLASAESLPTDAIRRQEALALRRSIDASQTVEALRIANQARAALASRNLDVAQTQVARLEAVAPGHSALAGLHAEVERLRGSLQGVARTASVERLGVKLFLSGNYKESADQLERAVGNGVTSPRIYLFLASSRAAQALLAPQGERPALVAEARRHYALAKPGAPTLTADQRFISPSILQLLGGS